MDITPTNRESFAYFLGWSAVKTKMGLHDRATSARMGWIFASMLGFTKEEYIKYVEALHFNNIKSAQYVVDNFDMLSNMSNK